MRCNLFMNFVLDAPAMDIPDDVFYAKDVPFVDRAPLDMTDMDDPPPLPAPDALFDQVEPEVSYKLLMNGSQRGKVD